MKREFVYNSLVTTSPDGDIMDNLYIQSQSETSFVVCDCGKVKYAYMWLRVFIVKVQRCYFNIVLKHTMDLTTYSAYAADSATVYTQECNHTRM